MNDLGGEFGFKVGLVHGCYEVRLPAQSGGFVVANDMGKEAAIDETDRFIMEAFAAMSALRELP